MDDKTSVLLGELSRFRRRFEAIEAMAPNCVLKTERSTILSRFQVRRTVPVLAPIPERDLPAGYSKMIIPGNGCKVLPERISSFDELASAIVLYCANGLPYVTANDEPMYKTAGWEVSHLVSIYGRDCDAVTKVFKAINHWCLINQKWLQSIGLLPPVAAIDEFSMLWPDVVLALAEQSANKPKWYISVSANMKINLCLWKNKNHREQWKEFTDSPWGVTDEQMAMIGDDPEDMHATLDDFIAESVTAIDSLLKLAERNAIREEQTPAQESKLENGLHSEGRRLVWGGMQFILTTNQAMVFELLVNAYPEDVLLSEFQDKGIGTLRDSFRRGKGIKEYDPCWHLIDKGSVKDSKRLIKPEAVKSIFRSPR